MKIDDLVEEAVRYLMEVNHHKQSSVKHNYLPGFRFIANDFKNSSHNTIDNTFFTDCYDKMTSRYTLGVLSKPQLIRYRKSLSVLKQYVFNGTISYKHQPAFSYSLPSAHNENILQRHLHNESLKLAESTVTTRGNIIRQFIRFLENTDQKDLSTLTEAVVLSFMEYISERRPAGISQVVPSIRDFLTFLYNDGILKKDIAETASIKVVRRHRIYGTLTTVEIECIISKIDRETHLGKRDYAIMLLSARNGLRSSDIINLELADIYWKSAEIVIIQKKTQNTVSCPIDIETGNALFDYILSARPCSGSTTKVFLSLPPEPRPLTSANLCHMLKKYSNAAGIVWNSSDRLGMHTFRRSLGTHLLENDVVLETIAQVLGHKSTASTKRYLSIAEGKLVDCILPMPHYCGVLEVHDV